MCYTLEVNEVEMIINKSKYCGFCQCPKSVWLKKNKSEEFVADQSAMDRMSGSNEICALECKVFGDYIDVPASMTGKADLAKLVAKTSELIGGGASVLTKASFMFDEAYCMVDILKKEAEGYSIYATKSSTSPNHHNYIVDIAYQKYILEHCGVNVVSTNVINVNTSYKFDGKLDIHKLFKISNVDELVDVELPNVEGNIAQLKEILNMEEEPSTGLNVSCHNPYPCGFWKYCSKHLPKNSVFDLYATSIQKKLEYYNKGIVTFEDLKNSGISVGKIQNMQINHNLKSRPTYVNKKAVKEFLSTISYPLYFLDFETVQLGIPKYKNSRPYQPMPFQYSLHYIEKEGGEVKHKEFISSPTKDPRKQIAKRLYKDIPQNACILAYNKFFERERLKDLAKLFPRMGKKLNVLAQNVIDLAVPFVEGAVYNKRMSNSISIKSVLPALYPKDSSLNYESLDGVNNGNDAMVVFTKMKNMTRKEQKQIKQELLDYCKLDTYAMVKIYEYLVKAVSE